MELHDFALELIGKAGADEYAVDRLIELVNDSGAPLPSDLAEVSFLNPFAVTLRYAEADVSLDFDRRQVRQLVRRLHDWVRASRYVRETCCLRSWNRLLCRPRACSRRGFGPHGDALHTV
jgi:hypothetical protein